jgi:hypothetical protein
MKTDRTSEKGTVAVLLVVSIVAIVLMCMLAILMSGWSGWILIGVAFAITVIIFAGFITGQHHFAVLFGSIGLLTVFGAATIKVIRHLF